MKESKSPAKPTSFENIQARCSASAPDLAINITEWEYFSGISHQLRDVLVRKTNLRSLDIGFSKRNFDTGPFIADIIKRNLQLRHLRVHAPVEFEDAQIIASALNFPHTRLVSLGLNLLEIGEDGAELILQAVQRHASLIRFEFFSSFDGSVARKTLIRLEKRLANTQGLLNCYEYDKGPVEFPTKRIPEPIARNRYFTLKNILILMRARLDNTETETPLKLLPRDILLMILIHIHPKITPGVCKRLCPSFFFKPVSAVSQTVDDAPAISPTCQ